MTNGGQIASDAVAIGGGDFDLTGQPFEAGAPGTTPSLLVQSGVTVTISSNASDTVLDRDLNLNGTLIHTGTASLNLNGHTLDIGEGGNYQLESNANVYGGSVVVENNGEFDYNSSGTGSVTDLTNMSGGTVEVDNGTLNLTGGGSSAGVFNVSGNLELSGSAYAINTATRRLRGAVP